MLRGFALACSPVAIGLVPFLIPILLSGLSAGTGETGDVMVSILDITPASFFSAIGIGSAPAGSSPSDKSLHFTSSESATGNGFVTLEIREAGPDSEFLTDHDEISIQQFSVLATENDETIVPSGIPVRDSCPNLPLVPIYGS